MHVAAHAQEHLPPGSDGFRRIMDMLASAGADPTGEERTRNFGRHTGQKKLLAGDDTLATDAFKLIASPSTTDTQDRQRGCV